MPETTMMPEYQQRVLDEQSELEGRIKRLTDVIHTNTFRMLAPAEQGRLHRQLVHMMGYARVLIERIEAF